LAPPPPPRQQARPSTHRKTEEERQLADERECEGINKGEGAKSPNHTTARKPGTL
jgi:hypothetical protein